MMGMVGPKLGKYLITGILGQGGMSSVYEGYDDTLGRRVAIKVITSRLDEFSEERIARFETEARVVARLSHPNIVPVFDFGRQNEIMYFVSPLIEGETLARKIASGPIPLETTRQYLAPLASALDYAHSLEIIHRDIKPQNIMIDVTGAPHLMDFGIAKVPEDRGGITKTGMLIGTLRYMAPEAISGRPIDHRIDIYALGLVTFEMLTGERAFIESGVSEYGLVTQIVAGKCQRLDALRPDLPKQVRQAVHQAFALDPKERFFSAKEFFEAAFPNSIQGGAQADFGNDLWGRVRKWFAKESGKPDDATDPAAHEATEGQAEESTSGGAPPQANVTPSPAGPAHETAATPRVAETPEPGEFTRLFQTAGRSTESVPAPSPTAPPVLPAPLKVQPGEFTRFFTTALPPETGPSELPRGPGEFTRTFAAPPQPTVPPPPPEKAPEPGEFTRMFGRRETPAEAPAPPPLAKPAEPAELPEPPPPPSVISTEIPNASAENEQRTKLFSTSPAGGSSATAPGIAPVAVTVPEFTQVYGIGGGGIHSAEPRAVLSIVSSTQELVALRRVTIDHTPFCIGRNSHQCHFSLAFDEAVSSIHAEIDRTNQGYVLRDLGSANGTYLDGMRLAPNRDEVLFFGARILLGSNTELVFAAEQLEAIPDLTGQSISNGRYQLISKLHSGAKSAVYSAHDAHFDDALLAIKILAPDLAALPGYRKQFKTEAGIARNLSHSNICSVSDFGEFELGTPGRKTLFVAMKHLDKGNIARRFLRGSHPELAVTADWLEQICAALDYLAARNVVHGGIKPSAIVFDSHEIPHLTDFAFASNIGSGAESKVIGRREFLAPEQWECAKLTRATDQYSLGALFYLMLTGSAPFEGQDNPTRREANLAKGPIPAHQRASENLRPALPAEISVVLQKAMSRNPEDRFATAARFAAEFRKALEAAPAPAAKAAHHVFISYHRCPASSYLASIVERELIDAGYEVFIDQNQRDTVGRFSAKIAAAIERSDVFICLLTDSALASPWVAREIEFALEKNKGLLPVFQHDFVCPKEVDQIPAPFRKLLEFDAVRIVDTQRAYMQTALVLLKDAIKQLL